MGPETPAGPADLRVAELAARQHGVISRHQLRNLGLREGAIAHRLRVGRLHRVHRGVYAVGQPQLTRSGRWLAAVLSCGPAAALSHRSAAALWGLLNAGERKPDVTSAHGHSRRRDVWLHRARLDREDRAIRERIPVTSVARTIFDLSEVVDRQRLARAAEEADRLGLLELGTLERLCERSPGRRGLRPVRELLETLVAPAESRSELERRFAWFCREYGFPSPATNVLVAGFVVDAVWQAQRVVVELDGFAFHGHRAAFERDRERDAALQVAGYRVVRPTLRRLERSADAIAAEIRELFASASGS